MIEILLISGCETCVFTYYELTTKEQQDVELSYNAKQQSRQYVILLCIRRCLITLLKLVAFFRYTVSLLFLSDHYKLQRCLS